ncbi:hypothetical protein LMG3431_02627 [Achromobacter pestifer]|uniref:Uncharacterized protein n=1 Tax=Achromobacter pestifer TaxID=1353889 RepID=A0A6S6Z2Z5_9BURK|nr:hypothetical protein LMG3431_02627 [Achromobacter pestifer]
MTALGPHIRVPPSRWKRESLSCGLFLASEAGRTSLSLWLRIPPSNLGETAVGRLEIQSGLGYRTYQHTDLCATRLVPMTPQVPLAEIAGFGQLLALAAELVGQVSGFSADRNLFYADERGGRFIFSDEQLEWGARYRLLSMHEVAPPLELGSALGWKPEGIFGGWYSYELALPSVFVGSKPDLPKEIADFLGHRIRSRRPRLHMVDPLPHHVEVDGTYVYPEPPESLLLRRSGSGETSVTASVGTGGAEISEQGDEWVRVRGPWTSGCEYVLAIDGSEQAIFRVEPCELFCPVGVTVDSVDLSWDLVTDAPLDADALTAGTVNIDCGNARIAAHLARLNDGWVLEETRLSLPGGSAKDFYAGSFGELRCVVPASLDASEESGAAEPAAPQPPTVIVNRWIDRLVVQDYGAEGARNVKRYLSNPSPENLYRLGSIMTSRLMPYIRAVQHQQRDPTEGDKDL